MGFQTLTVKYDSIQDRIVVIVRVPGADYALLLTRRFTCGLLAMLARQVQQTQGDTRLEKAGLQDELLSMKHVRAVSQVRSAQADASPPPPLPERLPSRLPTRVDVTHEADEVALLTFFAGDEVLGRLVFRPRELHWFLERLVAHAGAAGWGDAIPVPEWLAQGTNEVTASSAPPTMAVH